MTIRTPPMRCRYDPSLRPPLSFVTQLPWHRVLLYTAIQLACVGCIFGISRTPFGFLFPFLLVVLIPFRLYAARPKRFLSALLVGPAFCPTALSLISLTAPISTNHAFVVS